MGCAAMLPTKHATLTRRSLGAQMVKYLGQTITPRCSTGSGVPGPRSPDIDKNRHPSLTYYDTGYTSLTLLVTPTITYGARTTKKAPHYLAHNASSHHSHKKTIQKENTEDLDGKKHPT